MENNKELDDLTIDATIVNSFNTLPKTNKVMLLASFCQSIYGEGNLDKYLDAIASSDDEQLEGILKRIIGILDDNGKQVVISSILQCLEIPDEE